MNTHVKTAVTFTSSTFFSEEFVEIVKSLMVNCDNSAHVIKFENSNYSPVIPSCATKFNDLAVGSLVKPVQLRLQSYNKDSFFLYDMSSFISANCSVLTMFDRYDFIEGQHLVYTEQGTEVIKYNLFTDVDALRASYLMTLNSTLDALCRNVKDGVFTAITVEKATANNHVLK